MKKKNVNLSQKLVLNKESVLSLDAAGEVLGGVTQISGCQTQCLTCFDCLTKSCQVVLTNCVTPVSQGCPPASASCFC